MPRSFAFSILFCLSLILLGDTPLLANATSFHPPNSPTLLAQSTQAPAGAYLAWYKLLMIAVIFVIWVRTSDWLNRDSIRLGRHTEMPPQIWNPIIVVTFLLGFAIVLFIPWFVVGFPIYLLLAWAPFFTYTLMRWGKMRAEPELRQLARAGKEGKGKAVVPEITPLPQDQGADLQFTAAGADQSQQQINLIRARQVTEFPSMKNMINDLLSKRAEVALWDYSRNGSTGKFQVDGVWHPLPPVEPGVGDMMLASLKFMAGLNPADRRSSQAGKFQVKNEAVKLTVEMTSQGTKTGERAQLKFLRVRKVDFTLPQLGMLPEVLDLLKSSLNSPSITIMSAPPGEGLTSSWKAALLNSGQLTRDCVALVRPNDNECEVENIQQREYTTPENQIDVLRTALLTQPDFLAVPEVESPQLMDMLVSQVVEQNRSLFLRSNSPSATAALLKMYAKAGDHRDRFIQAVQLSIGQKLIRRLCPSCRVEMQVKPELITKLGGDPRQQKTIFDHYRLPPPEQRVDEKGRPIEFPPCSTCGGIGYLGRIAVYETLEVNDRVRDALRKSPTVEKIETIAQQTGKKTLAQNAQKLVLLGVTSIAEIQRVFKK